MPEFAVGDKFTVDPDAGFPASCIGVVYAVTHVPTGKRQINYQGTPVDGRGRGVRAPEWTMRRYVEGETPLPSRAEAYVPPPTAGALVRIKPDAPSTSVPKGVLFVVMGPARNHLDAVKLVRLGGDGGRYWPRVPNAWLDVLDASRVRLTQEDGAVIQQR